MTQNTIEKELNLSEKGLYYIPEEAFDAHITQLVLRDNKIRVIPDEIMMLINLKRLAVSNNRLEKVSPALACLEMLDWLDLTRNKLFELPFSIHKMPFVGLGLSENAFTEIPQCVLRMKRLRKFGFFSNMVQTISPSIANLISLTKIDLSHNLIFELPEEIGELLNLKWLNLTRNCLKKLPTAFGKLINLEELGLGENRLETLPDISKLRKLRILPVYKNKLKHVCLNNLESIEKLDLSENLITDFPNEVIYLRTINTLNLSNNKIREINLDIKSPTSTISHINISSNEIGYLPFKFLNIFESQTIIAKSIFII
ncbi:Protein lap4 [Dictyocoela roeselum]|nr:Protein lap4 [Dictyocoela roeselum]